MRLLPLLLAIAACSKPAPPKTDFEAFERKWVAETDALASAMRERGETVDEKLVLTSYRGVYLGASGIWIDRARIASLAELSAKRVVIEEAIDRVAKILPTAGYSGLVVVLDLHGQSAAIATEAFRLFAGKPAIFDLRRDDPAMPDRATERLFDGTLRAIPSANKPALSVFLDTKTIWVGVTQIDEFTQIADLPDGRDFEKLDSVLRSMKAGEQFAERTDIELAVSTGTADDVLAALRAAMNAGFIDIAILAPDALSAKPSL